RAGLKDLGELSAVLVGQEDPFPPVLKPDRLAIRRPVDRAIFPHPLAAREKRHDREESEADERIRKAKAWGHRGPPATWMKVRENAAADERSGLQRVIPSSPDYSRPTRFAAAKRGEP